MWYDCKTTKLAYDKIQQLKKRSHICFDQKEVDRAIKFFQEILYLSGDWEGEQFVLQDWQKVLFIEPIFGLKYKDGRRVIREVYCQLPRGTGKSAFSAGLALYYLLAGGKGNTLYCAGSTKETAKNVFNDCVAMVQSSPKLKAILDIRGDKMPSEIMTKSEPRSRLTALSSDKRFDGPKPAFICMDEYHRATNKELHEIFSQSIKKLRQSLMITITNPGYDPSTHCYQEYQKAKRWLEGGFEEERYLAIVPEPNEGDKWDDINTAKRVNLGLHHTVELDDLKQELAQAVAIPSYKPTYCRYRLNQWYIGGGESWLPWRFWEACKADYSVQDLKGCPLYLGVDYAPRNDLTSLTGIALKDGVPHVISYNYRPDSMIKNVEGEAPYRDWFEEGFVFSGGHEEVTTTDTIFEQTKELAEFFDLQMVGIDRARMGDYLAKIESEGLPVVEIPQSLTVFTDPINQLEDLIKTRKLKVPKNHPCLDWQFQNAQIKINDSGLKKFEKGNSSNKRNDAIVALTQAVYVWRKLERGPVEEDWYSSFYDGTNDGEQDTAIFDLLDKL